LTKPSWDKDYDKFLFIGADSTSTNPTAFPINNTTIGEIKLYFKDHYGLDPEDQYYTKLNEVCESEIVEDNDKLGDFRFLGLRIDSLLKPEEAKSEAAKVVKQGGEEMLKNFQKIKKSSVGFVQVVGEVGMKAGSKWDDGLWQKQLRMWKRSNRFRRKGSNVATQFCRNTISVARNTFNGVARSSLDKIDDNGATEAYEKIRAKSS